MQKQQLTWKRVFTSILCFVLFLCALSVPFYSAIQDGYNYNEINMLKKKFDLEKENSFDVLFIGDSETWVTYNPLQMFHEQGFTSYNLGTPGQWVGDSKLLLEYALKTQKPKVMVLGANTLYLDVSQESYVMSKLFPLFHYHEYYFHLFRHESVLDPKKGANIRSTVEPYKGRRDYMNKKTDIDSFSEDNEEYLNEILQICEENDIALFLASAPSAKNWNTGKDEAVRTWADDHSVPYIDYNTQEESQKIGLDWNTDTRDGGDHINMNGSEKVSSDIAQILKEKYSLPDHRSDSEYSSWEKYYQKYFGSNQ